MKSIVAFVRVVDMINTWVGKVVAFAVLPLAAVLAYGVIMRHVFGQAVSWEGDIAWLLFLCSAVLAGPYVLRLEGHVRLDLMYSRLSPRRKAVADSLTFAFFLLFIVLLTWYAIPKAWWSISVLEKNPHSIFHGPIYPARVSLALASVLMLLQGLAEFVRNVTSLLGAEWRVGQSEY